MRITLTYSVVIDAILANQMRSYFIEVHTNSFKRA